MIAQTWKVPATGRVIPRLGLGTWKSTPAEAVKDAVYHAIKAGYRHIDCAAVYGNETHIGEAIKRALAEGVVKREDLWITSKLWNTNHAAEHVAEACQRTLKDLGLEYLDLYLIHFPIPLEYVPPSKKYPAEFSNDDGKRVITVKVPLSETWGAMEKLVDEGLTKHIGVSNFDLQLLQDLMTYARILPMTNQIELHPYLSQKNIVRFCGMHNISVTAYSPFGGKSYVELGMSSEDEPQVLADQVLAKIGEKNKKTVAQVVLRWILQRAPHTIVIPKSVSPARLDQNMQIFDFEISADDMAAIDKLDIGRRYNDTGKYTDMNGSYWPIFG